MIIRLQEQDLMLQSRIFVATIQEDCEEHLWTDLCCPDPQDAEQDPHSLQGCKDSQRSNLNWWKIIGIIFKRLPG